MSVPTKPHTFATCAMFLADRGTSPGVDTASHGSATLRTGSSGSSPTAHVAPASPASATRAPSVTTIRSLIVRPSRFVFVSFLLRGGARGCTLLARALLHLGRACREAERQVAVGSRGAPGA